MTAGGVRRWWLRRKPHAHDSLSIGSILLSRRCTSFNIRLARSNLSGGRSFSHSECNLTRAETASW